ncbi:MAG: thiamine diphosphokinase [Fimbriimonas sp.]
MEASRRRVLGVLAGGDFSASWFGNWARSADLLLAADAGADHLVAHGFTPDRTVGDLDSLRTQGLPDVRKVADQEHSDCDKLLALAQEMGVEEITLIGVEGDRLDHVLGTLASAIKSSLRVRLALRRGLGWVLKGDAAIPSIKGELISLMPLAVCEGASILGVEWPLRDVVLSPFGQVSLSNRAAGEEVQILLPTGAAALFALGKERETPSWQYVAWAASP